MFTLLNLTLSLSANASETFNWWTSYLRAGFSPIPSLLRLYLLCMSSGYEVSNLLESDIVPFCSHALYLPGAALPIIGEAHSAHGRTFFKSSIISVRSLSKFLPINLKLLDVSLLSQLS